MLKYNEVLAIITNEIEYHKNMEKDYSEIIIELIKDGRNTEHIKNMKMCINQKMILLYKIQEKIDRLWYNKED